MANEFKAKNGIITPTLQSTVATGTSPFTVDSTTLVTNLNADTLDGNHASAFATASHTHSYLPLSGGNMTGGVSFAAGQTWPTFNQNTTGTANSAIELTVPDLRSTSITPSYFGQGLNAAFMGNATDGLADGGTYHGILQLQQWSDASGGGAHQLGFTDNNNIWHRGSSGALTSWSSWAKIWDSSNLTNLNQLTNGPGFITASASITGTSSNITGTVAIANGGTGATTATDARSNLGLGTASTFNTYNNGVGIPVVAADGTMEIARFIDFHKENGDLTDYTVRLDGGSAGSTTLTLTGNFTASGNINSNSDERIKKGWNPLPANFIELLSEVKHGTYTRLDTNQVQAGVSAQSLQKVLPEAVTDGECMSVAYGNAALVSAIALATAFVEQRTRLDKLETLVQLLLEKLGEK